MIKSKFKSITLAFIAICSLTLAGCDIISVIMHERQQQIPARFNLDSVEGAQRMRGKTLIVVDDLYNSFDQSNAIHVIGQQVQNKLVENEVIKVENFVPQRDLSKLKGDLGPSKYKKLSFVELGKKLGATQVISVEITDATLNQGESGIQPRCMTQVKVFDVNKQKKIFPSAVMNPHTGLLETVGDSGFGVNVQIFHAVAIDKKSRKALMGKLMRKTGRMVAELFYEHKLNTFDND